MSTIPTDEYVRKRRLLQAVDSAEGKAVIKQGSTAPVFRGAGPDGFDYVCGACGRATIIENVTDRQFWNLVLRCFACGHLSSTPRYPSGLVLPNTTMPLPPGEYLVSSTVNITRELVVTDVHAVERRASETGHLQQNSPQLVTNSDWFESLIKRARDLLGDEFDNLAAKDDRGQRALTTPPRDRHRFMELVARVRQSADTYETKSPTIDVIAATELYLSLNLLERWKNDPAWPGIIASLKNPPDFPHAIITLAAASYLTDVGNSVALHVEKDSSRRAADLRLEVTLNRRFAIEVKAPRELSKSSKTLDEALAQRIIKKCFKKSGTGANDQLTESSIRKDMGVGVGWVERSETHQRGVVGLAPLDPPYTDGSSFCRAGLSNPENPGLLLVGGFHLSQSDLDLLEGAAIGILAREGRNKCHIVGIVIISVGVMIDVTPLPDTPNQFASVCSDGTFSLRLARNPVYQGELKISTHCRSPARAACLAEGRWPTSTARVPF